MKREITYCDCCGNQMTNIQAEETFGIFLASPIVMTSKEQSGVGTHSSHQDSVHGQVFCSSLCFLKALEGGLNKFFARRSYRQVLKIEQVPTPLEVKSATVISDVYP